MEGLALIVALESELPEDMCHGIPVYYSGVGKVNAAYATMKAIRDGARYIINFGTAGLVKGQLEGLHEVWRIVQRDMLAEPQAPRGTTPFENLENKHTGTSPHIAEDGEIVIIMGNEGQLIRLGTGDSFVMEHDEWFLDKSVDIVDMEAFAIAKICAMDGIEFKCYKWVSDFADEDAAETWEANQSAGAKKFSEHLGSLIKKKELRPLPNNSHFCTMPFMHAMVDPNGYVRPCCSWAIDVDDMENDPWPNIFEVGLAEAVQHKKFKEVRHNLLNKKDVAGCRKCHWRESSQSGSFRTTRICGKDRHWINEDHSKFTDDFHELRYMETAFSSLCNLSCRMCWSGVSSTFHRIVKPGKKVELNYDVPIEQYDTDLSSLREIKIVGGEPLMEQKHDQFIAKLVESGMPDNQLEMVYHTNCTMLPSPQVQEFWKRCRRVTLNMSIDSYGLNNWHQRPGPYTWEDLLKVTDQFKQWSTEWGNINLAIGATLTKISVFHIHEMEKWVDDYWFGTPGWHEYGVSCAERPHILSLAEWRNNPERIKQVKDYLNTKVRREHIKRHVASFFDYKERPLDYDKFWREQTALDNYYGYKVEQWL